MAVAEQTCYRHPSRETGVSCSSCGRPICTDCMIPTPVGMRCPECAKQRTKVQTASTMFTYVPRATYALIAINVVVFLAQVLAGGGGTNATHGSVYAHGVLWAPLVADGEWWRLITAGFMHASVLHILFNMVALYFLGQLVEPVMGTVRFVALYFAALLAGSFGVLLFQHDAASVGASGAVFGLFGAAFVLMRRQGVNPMQTSLGPILILNLLISFTGGIAWGAHLGGLIGGGLCALLIGALDRGSLRGRQLGTAACVGVAAVSLVAALAVAGS